MRFDIITIFPQIFDSYLNESILKRAKKKGLIKIKVNNLRDFVPKRGLTQTGRRLTRKQVDDKPFGGGPGMVLKIEPIIRAIVSILRGNRKEERGKKTKIILFTPSGKQFNNKTAAQLAKNYDHLILIAGRYEGTDERLQAVLKNLKLKSLKLSIGDYVLTGGELPSMVLIDAVSRQIKGVLGKNESLEEQRFGVGEPVYTRPEVFEWKGKKYKTPKVLLSGNHKKIEEWKKKITK